MKDPGVQATKEVIGNILGLDINYWALVDLKVFQSLIDAVGGINLDVARKVPIGGGTDLTTGKKYPIRVHPDRARICTSTATTHCGSPAHERDPPTTSGCPGKCVLNAMAKQLNPLTVVTKIPRDRQSG